MGGATIVVSPASLPSGLFHQCTEHDLIRLRPSLGRTVGVRRVWALVGRCPRINRVKLWHGVDHVHTTDPQHRLTCPNVAPPYRGHCCCGRVRRRRRNALAPYNPKLARGTLYVSWIVWGTGVPIALMVIALLIYRFASVGPPAAPALASVFLPLGPCGQGSFGIVTLGVVAGTLAYEHNTSMIPKLIGDAAFRVADAIYGTCLITGLVLWGLALAWYTFGVAMFIEGVVKDPKILSVGNFTVGLWALTFPLG